jgi:hypothetical protein
MQQRQRGDNPHCRIDCASMPATTSVLVREPDARMQKKSSTLVES